MYDKQKYRTLRGVFINTHKLLKEEDPHLRNGTGSPRMTRNGILYRFTAPGRGEGPEPTKDRKCAQMSVCVCQSEGRKRVAEASEEEWGRGTPPILISMY